MKGDWGVINVFVGREPEVITARWDDHVVEKLRQLTGGYAIQYAIQVDVPGLLIRSWESQGRVSYQIWFQVP